MKGEIRKLLNEERDRRRAEANRKIWARQHQERVQHVRNAIVSKTGNYYYYCHVLVGEHTIFPKLYALLWINSLTECKMCNKHPCLEDKQLTQRHS